MSEWGPAPRTDRERLAELEERLAAMEAALTYLGLHWMLTHPRLVTANIKQAEATLKETLRGLAGEEP